MKLSWMKIILWATFDSTMCQCMILMPNQGLKYFIILTQSTTRYYHTNALVEIVNLSDSSSSSSSTELNFFQKNSRTVPPTQLTAKTMLSIVCPPSHLTLVGESTGRMAPPTVNLVDNNLEEEKWVVIFKKNQRY